MRGQVFCFRLFKGKRADMGNRASMEILSVTGYRSYGILQKLPHLHIRANFTTNGSKMQVKISNYFFIFFVFSIKTATVYITKNLFPCGLSYPDVLPLLSVYTYTIIERGEKVRHFIPRKHMRRVRDAALHRKCLPCGQYCPPLRGAVGNACTGGQGRPPLRGSTEVPAPADRVVRRYGDARQKLAMPHKSRSIRGKR